MAVCKRCGCEFDPSTARRIIGRSYGKGTYNDYYPEADVCEDCAVEEVSADYAAGAEVAEMMGDSWYDD